MPAGLGLGAFKLVQRPELSLKMKDIKEYIGCEAQIYQDRDQYQYQYAASVDSAEEERRRSEEGLKKEC